VKQQGEKNEERKDMVRYFNQDIPKSQLAGMVRKIIVVT
jgi:hypothetical protein